jgi:hypothetical protein
MWLKDPQDPAQRTHILQLLEHNCRVVADFHLRVCEPLLGHEVTMWKRLKSADPSPASSRKISTHTVTDQYPHIAPPLPPSKKLCSTPTTSNKSAKRKPAANSSKKISCTECTASSSVATTFPSSTQCTLDNYFTTMVPPRDIIRPQPPPQRTKRSDSNSSAPTDQVLHCHRRPKPAKRQHGAQDSGIIFGVETAGNGGVAAVVRSLISCYTIDNNPWLNINATSHPYGMTTRRETTILNYTQYPCHT